MRRHDALLGWIQKRPAVLKELIESEGDDPLDHYHNPVRRPELPAPPDDPDPTGTER
jgi:hypothetical protein